jgi:hypothetical protein
VKHAVGRLLNKTERDFLHGLVQLGGKLGEFSKTLNALSKILD